MRKNMTIITMTAIRATTPAAAPMTAMCSGARTTAKDRMMRIVARTAAAVTKGPFVMETGLSFSLKKSPVPDYENRRRPDGKAHIVRWLMRVA